MKEIGTGNRNIMLQIKFILSNYAFVKGLYRNTVLNSVGVLYIPLKEMSTTIGLFSLFFFPILN